jgi:hypothetical protein
VLFAGHVHVVLPSTEEPLGRFLLPALRNLEV